MGLEETAWGKMCVLTVETFHDFIKESDVNMRRAGQCLCFPENHDLFSLFKQFISLWRIDMRPSFY